MGKEQVVRLNRCGREMKFLLAGCFFFFAAMQMLADGGIRSGMVNAVNLALYMVFVPGFQFLAGYQYNYLRRMNSGEYRKRWLGQRAVFCYACFFVLAVLCSVAPAWKNAVWQGGGRMLLDAAVRTLTLTEIPSVCAIFLAMALTLFVVRLADAWLSRLTAHRNQMLLLGAVLLLCAFLRARGETYPLLAAFVGAEGQAAVPCLPYFAFFLLGAWTEEHKPGFRWKLFLTAAAVTGVSLLLYRTPLQPLCRVTASVLLVYVVYLAAEGLAELTLRFTAFRNLCGMAEPVFFLYMPILFAIGEVGEYSGKLSLLRVLPLAACLLLAIFAAYFLLWSVFRGYGALAERFSRTKHRTVMYFVLYTAAFAVLLVLTFLPFLWHGKTLLWRADTVSQYYPRAVYFANYIRELVSNFLHGNFELPMYDFRIGMGGEVAYSMEPLYFLVALFGAEHAEFTQTLLILLRFYLAGITSSVFFLYFRKDYFTTFLGSIVYVFCGFSLMGGARHPMFMVPMILFPLQIIVIEEILRGRRWYLCTIVTALSLFSNYYFLYMSTFGMGVYFIVRYFCRDGKKSLKGFIGKGLVISGSYLLGAAMACIILVSNLGMYAGSGRGSSAVIKTPSLFYYSAQWPLRCLLFFPDAANAPGDWLRLGFLPISFFAVMLLFMKKKRRELKVLSVLSAIAMLLPLTGFVLSGFSSVTNRWCYMLALLAAYIVADCLPDLCRLSGRERRILAAGLGLYGLFAFFGGNLEGPFVKLAFVCLCATFAVLLLVQEDAKRLTRYGKQCLMCLLTFVMVFHSGFTVYELSRVVWEYTDPGQAQSLSENTPLTAVEKLGDDSFYRVGTPKLNYYTISSSMMLDYRSIYLFYSTLNGNLTEYLEKMGATTYSVTQFMGLNNRAFLNALAAVKYYAGYTENNTRALPYGYEEVLRTQEHGQETSVSENRYALPLGYTYRDVISAEELEQYDVTERQEVMLQKAVLDGDETVSQVRQELGIRDAGDPELTLQPLKIRSAKELGIRLLDHALVAEGQTVEAGAEAEDAADDGTAGDAAGAGDETAVDDSAAQDAAGVEVSGQGDATGQDTAGAGDEIAADDEAAQKTRYALKLKFEGKPNSETYLVLKNAVLEGDMSEEPINITFRVGDGEERYSYKFRPDDDRYCPQQPDYVFNLGYHEDPITSVTVRMDRAGEIHFDSLELCSQPMEPLASYTQALTEDVLENVEIGTNRVSGEISLDEDRLLVLSIPFQRGWSARVDGEPAELLRADYMYMALPLDAGAHTVELTFEIPGVKYALAIMPGAVVLFIVLCFVTWLVRRRRRAV